MKKLLLIAILCMVGLISGNAAENRWHVYGGANLSHNTESLYEGSYGWGAGGFLGGGYEINFSKYVSLSPQLEINYIKDTDLEALKQWRKDPANWTPNTTIE